MQATLKFANVATSQHLEKFSKSKLFELAENLVYLSEHELVSLLTRDLIGVDSAEDQIVEARITAKGLDFLQDDGGLSALLNTVTVCIAPDTLRMLLGQKIMQSSAPDKDKQWLTERLRTLPDRALDQLLNRLVFSALDAAPDAWSTIKTWFQDL